MTPGIQKIVPLPFETVLALLPDALKSEGFGVLTEIDVRDTLRQKLGVSSVSAMRFGLANGSDRSRATRRAQRSRRIATAR